MIKRRVINDDIELKILVGIIVSTSFARKIVPDLKSEYFSSDYIGKVFDWCKEFYNIYKECPGKHIQDIYEENKEQLEEAQQKIIETFLSKLSKDYEQQEEFNVEYLVDSATAYIKQKSIRSIAERTLKYLEHGKIDKAEQEFESYKKIAKVTSDWVNPFSSDFIKETYLTEEEGEDNIFIFPGALGKIVGWHQRDWLVAVLAPMKRGKCIAEGTMISLADGSLKSIENIIKDKDKYILSKDNSGKIVKGEITDYYVNGLKECFLVKTRLGKEITVTYNHPFFTPNGWVELNKISIGGFIAVPRKYNDLGIKSFESYKLKLLAYMIAEGCFRSTSYTFTNKSKKIQNDFKICVEQIGDYISKTKDPMSVRIVNEKGRGYSGGSNLRKWLAELGMHQKLSKNKIIPNFIFQLKNEDIALFLSVLFTCDGSIYKDRKNLIVSYGSASKRLIYQINHLLLRFGIIGKIKESTYKGFHSWEIRFTDIININKFISQIGFCFEKQKRAEKFISELEEKRCRKSNFDAIPYEVIKTIIPENERPIKNENIRQCFKNKGKISRTALLGIINLYPQIKTTIEDDLLWDSIVEIIPLGKQETFDLTIKDYHNFIANDIFVHNSFFLMEMAFRAFMNHKKVVFFSLEMSEKRVEKRLLRRVTAHGKIEGEYLYPCFDCEYNQNGECARIERTNKITLLNEAGNKPVFKKDMKYKTCTACRGTSNYRVATWYIIKKREKQSMQKSVRKANSLTKMYGDNFRLKSYPAGTANINDLISALDHLEYTENFIPDVIVIDYADILKPEDSRLIDPRAKADSTWIKLKGMADSRHCLVVTASQGTRKSIDKKSISQTDVAEDIRKLAHLDVMYGLSQTQEEKAESIMRVSILAHRDEDANELQQVICLQQRGLGQVLLDSEITGMKTFVEDDSGLINND